MTVIAQPRHAERAVHGIKATRHEWCADCFPNAESKDRATPLDRQTQWVASMCGGWVSSLRLS